MAEEKRKTVEAEAESTMTFTTIFYLVNNCADIVNNRAAEQTLRFNQMVVVVIKSILVDSFRTHRPHLTSPELCIPCAIFDDTGSFIFKARLDQVEFLKQCAVLILYNAKVGCLGQAMWLEDDDLGHIEVCSC
ncbi:Uncharacterized protein LOK49_LG10G00133 [Camellia lanceoleosa]|uniref:Uncharacterized protein n=1 Tax=Camellia lanceoleosa TaxID=1840588 RepID=A0ACC0G8M5_9ERIC|nr:Uncharacterized protein LOK49_LG10G00133 [Camellia lanceoleosa]